MVYTLSQKPALNDGHEFNGQFNNEYYEDVYTYVQQMKLKDNYSYYCKSIFSDRSQRQEARFRDYSLRVLALNGYISNVQLETLSDDQCRILIGVTKMILDGRLTMQNALLLSLPDVRKLDLIHNHMHIKNYPILISKIDALSEHHVDDEHILPIIDASDSLYFLQALISIGYLSELDAITLSAKQARFLAQMYCTPMFQTKSFAEVRQLLPITGYYSDCIDFYATGKDSILTREQVAQLTPEETDRLVRLCSQLQGRAFDDSDWRKSVIFRSLGWPVPAIDEKDQPFSLRHKLYTRVVSTGYLSDADAQTLTYREASVLIVIHEQLRQSGLSFPMARPLLTDTHLDFIQNFGPNAAPKQGRAEIRNGNTYYDVEPNNEGKIRLALSDIACLSEGDIHVISGVYFDDVAMEEITSRLGRPPMVVQPIATMVSGPLR